MFNLPIIESNVINKENVDTIIPRFHEQLEEIKNQVRNIIKKVIEQGDEALIELTEKYDGVHLKREELRVTEEELTKAYDKINPDLIEALKVAKKNIFKFHQAQKKQDWYMEIMPGVKTGQIYRPIETIGVYVPGGKAVYPSTVLMACIPAQVAGVKEINITSPPQANKTIAPEILVAAQECGVRNIFKVGGAQAIAALAYGTHIIPKVDKIIGPGNKWVNSAKIQVSESVAIDTPAGPSEILIIADETTNVEYLIWDLFSQIEHDPDNIGLIITHSKELIKKIVNTLPKHFDTTLRKDIIKSALEQKSLIIHTENLMDSIKICNLIAPEHVELLIDDPKAILTHMQHCGSVFLGEFSPVALGDYSAGTNHILPTSGHARKYSGLNLFDFLKIIDVLECSKEGLNLLSKAACTLAEYENLFAHKKSIEVRLKDKE